MEAEEKIENYRNAHEELKLLLGKGKFDLDEIGKMAIVATVMKMYFSHFLFSGFYRLMPDNNLQIGPYQGNLIACGIIPMGMGVCGKAAQQREIIIVGDVSNFPGYIACDSETRSEIVVPVFSDGKLIGVYDVDSDEVNAFDEIDAKWLNTIMAECFS